MSPSAWAAVLIGYVLVCVAVRHRWERVGDWMLVVGLFVVPILGLLYLFLSGDLAAT